MPMIKGICGLKRYKSVGCLHVIEVDEKLCKLPYKNVICMEKKAIVYDRFFVLCLLNTGCTRRRGELALDYMEKDSAFGQLHARGGERSHVSKSLMVFSELWRYQAYHYEG